MDAIPTKSPGDKLFSNEWNELAKETQNAITDTGITLTGADLFQLSKSMSNYAALGDFYNDTGSATAYVLNPISSRKAPTAYADGMRVRFAAANTNTGAATVNVNSLGVVNILDSNGAPLGGGEIQSTKMMTLYYNGTDFVLIDSSTLLAYKHLTKNVDGLTISNNTTDPLHDIDIAPGSFEDSFTTELAFSLYTTFTKQIDANWVQGTNAGGFPSGLTLSANTWYHVFIIAKPDGTIDAGFDTSLSATNLSADVVPAGFLHARRIGSVLTDVALDILPFFQFGTRFVWDTPITDSTTLPAVITPVALSTPPGVNTEARINIGVQASGVGPTVVIINSPYQTGTFSPVAASTSDITRNVLDVITDTSSTIQHYWTSNAPTSYFLITIGWTELEFIN